MIIIAQRMGQLGNRLLLFAHLIAFAQDHQLTVVNLAFDEYASLFQPTASDLFCRYPAVRSWVKPKPKLRGWLFRVTARLMRELADKRLPFIDVCRLADDQAFSLDARFAETARRKIVFLGGWLFRHPNGLSQNAAALRAYFRPQETILQSARQTLQTARRQDAVLIGVHIRQGDYREYDGGRYFYTSEQYVAILEKTRALFGQEKIAFLICSNEPQEASLFERFNVTFAQGSAVEDMYTLAQCDYLIGPPSTFTWWASFYGDVPLCQLKSAEFAFTRTDFQVFSG